MNIRGIFFNRTIRSEVWRMLADLTGTGMDLSKALTLVGRTFEKRGPGIKSILEEMRKSLATDRFVQVVRKYTPESESLIFAQFGSSKDSDLFHAAARIAEVEQAIKSAIMSALFKPVFVLILMTALLYFLGKDFYPTLMLVSPMENWPDTWQTVAKMALWVAEKPFMLFIYAGVAAVIYKVVQLNYIGPFRNRLDKIPPFSLYRLSVGATFAFVILENAAVGNSINSNLMRTLSKDSSRYTRSRIMEIEKNISSMNIGQATMAAGFDFPDPELNAVLEAYAEQPNWVESFRAYAETWLKRLEKKVKAAVAVLNIVLMMISAAFIAVVGQTIFGIVNVIN